jgi:uncharacterized protein YggE
MRAPEGITVMGEATRDAEPESVEVFFEIRTAALTAALAAQESVTRAKQIGQAIAVSDSGKTEYQACGMAVWPVMAPLMNPPVWMSNPVPLLPPSLGPVGSLLPVPTMTEGPPVMRYEAVSSVKVTVRDPNRVGEVIDCATRAGASLAIAIRFVRQDEAGIRRQLLEEAVRETRRTADSLAAVIGKSAGDPVAIREEFGSYSGQAANGEHQIAPMTLMPGVQRLWLAPRPLQYCARVSVTYQIQ